MAHHRRYGRRRTGSRESHRRLYDAIRERDYETVDAMMMSVPGRGPVMLVTAEAFEALKKQYPASPANTATVERAGVLYPSIPIEVDRIGFLPFTRLRKPPRKKYYWPRRPDGTFPNIPPDHDAAMFRQSAIRAFEPIKRFEPVTLTIRGH